MFIYQLKGNVAIDYDFERQCVKFDPNKEWNLLCLASSPKEAIEVAEREAQERFGIRKCSVGNFKVVGMLNKPALFWWESDGGSLWSELHESEFTPLRDAV